MSKGKNTLRPLDTKGRTIKGVMVERDGDDIIAVHVELVGPPGNSGNPFVLFKANKKGDKPVLVQGDGFTGPTIDVKL